LGDTIRNLLKTIDPDNPDPAFCEEYDEIELKYKIAKILESKKIIFSCQF
jgi:hypothetical protein